MAQKRPLKLSTAETSHVLMCPYVAVAATGSSHHALRAVRSVPSPNAYPVVHVAGVQRNANSKSQTYVKLPCGGDNVYGGCARASCTYR